MEASSQRERSCSIQGQCRIPLGSQNQTEHIAYGHGTAPARLANCELAEESRYSYRQKGRTRGDTGSERCRKRCHTPPIRTSLDICQRQRDCRDTRPLRAWALPLLVLSAWPRIKC